MRKFSTNQFAWAHGRQPKGFGSWAFLPIEVKGETALADDELVWVHQSNYGAAKKEAVSMYPEVSVWEVAS